MARSSNSLRYIALVLAVMNALQFFIFNSRGILSWSGVGVYVTVLYAVVFVLSAIVWLVARVRSKSRLSAAFWVVMFFPMVFIALLPEKFLCSPVPPIPRMRTILAALVDAGSLKRKSRCHPAARGGAACILSGSRLG
jgi:hypothetical protein